MTMLQPSEARPADIIGNKLVRLDDVRVHYEVRTGMFVATKTTIRAVDGVTF
jgi:ABC-type microcin C transport system duplicated ATPase subunit YejF